MAANLPEYSEWKQLVADNWEYWEYYKNLYNYSIQKPSNTFWTNKLYPKFYQERLLKKQYSENMQMLGKINETELEDYVKQTGDANMRFVYNYHTYGARNVYFDWHASIGFALLGFISFAIGKNSSWTIVTPTFGFILYGAIKNKAARQSIGSMVDFTNWVAEQRKAKVWLAESPQKFAKLPSLPELQKQIVNLVKDFK